MTGVPSQAKRQAILDAATAAFLRSGYATSVDDIAAAAGVGKQTVYRHFGDKQALFLAALSAARTSVVERAPAPTAPRTGAPGTGAPGTSSLGAGDPGTGDPGTGDPGTGDPVGGLTRMGERILVVALSPTVAALHRLTIAEIGNHPELSRQWGDGAAPYLDEELTGYLRRCGAAGTLDVPDPARAARQFAFLLITEGRMATAYGTKALPARQRRAIAAETADLIARAYRPVR